MKRLWCILILALVQTVSAGTVRLAGEVQIMVPDGWQVMADTVNYPFLLMPASREAELLVFKSTIERNATIDDHDALRMSVDRVIDSVVMTLPEAKLLTTTGMYEGDHARFTVEFTSEESPEEGVFRHNLTGILYRLPSGDEVLFTLWARSNAAVYSLHQSEIDSIGQHFTYTAAHTADIFITRRSQPFYYAIPIALAISLFALIELRRRQRRRPEALSEPWQCPCGWANDQQAMHCSRCGQVRAADQVTT